MAKQEVVTKLTAADRKALVKHEETIRNGLTSFIEVGHALMEIQDSRLYREDFNSFDEYFETQWGLAKQTAYQKIAAAAVVDSIQKVRNHGHVPLIETHALELVKAKDDAPKVWAEVLKQSPKLADGSPCTTAKKIAAIRDEMLKPKAAPSQPSSAKATGPAAAQFTPPVESRPSSAQVKDLPAPTPTNQDDEPPFEPPLSRVPGEDDGDEELDAKLGEIESWDGAKLNQLLKAVTYFENKLVKAEAILNLRIARLFPHHGLPLKRWDDELASKTRQLKQFKQKLEAAKADSKARAAAQ